MHRRVVVAYGFGEGFEFLFLVLVEFGRHFNLDGDVEVAFVSSGKGGHTFIADPESRAALGAGGNFD